MVVVVWGGAAGCWHGRRWRNKGCYGKGGIEREKESGGTERTKRNAHCNQGLGPLRAQYSNQGPAALKARVQRCKRRQLARCCKRGSTTSAVLQARAAQRKRSRLSRHCKLGSATARQASVRPMIEGMRGQIQKEMQKRGGVGADQSCEHRMFPVQEQKGML